MAKPEGDRAASQRLYGIKRWRRVRMAQLAAEPLCRMCRAMGRVTSATICDHIEPHRGDWHKFWDGPFQSLCKPCHDGVKQSQERTGVMKGAGADGMPIDPNHGWRRP